MSPITSDDLGRLVQQLRQAPGLEGQLVGQQAAVVRAALDGQDIHTIANQNRITEETVWQMLDGAARMATGRMPENQAETGGLGSDTDPGVTGGYGDTGFGALGNEGPGPANPDEP